MKRVIKQHMTIYFEIEIEIHSSTFAHILSSSDLTDTEYDSFITGMISQFNIAGYALNVDSDYIHSSNVPGSLSEYYTFTRWVDDIQVIVVMHVKVSDHPDKSKHCVPANAKRAKYVAKISNEISKNSGADSVVPIPMDIIFDDKHFKSFSSAQFYLNSRLHQIDDDVDAIVEEQKGKEQ